MGSLKDGDSQIKIIEPRKGGIDLRLGEVFRARELLWMFIWRNITVRYRQMALGFMWMIFEPLAILIIMSVVFGRVLKLPTDGYPYPVFAFAGLMPWLLFSKSCISATGSLRDNMGVISKVYFPRVIMPISAIAKDLFDSLVSLCLLLILAFAWGFAPEPQILLIPLFMCIPVGFSLGVGLWLSAAAVKYRDLTPALTIALQLGMYLTPIIYSPAIVPPSFLSIYKMNPMYWAVEGFRWCILGRPFDLAPQFFLSLGLVLLIIISGMFIFSRLERFTVDVF